MTAKQALSEARRRWGKKAVIGNDTGYTWFDPRTKEHKPIVKAYRVGVVMWGWAFHVKGMGDNWVEAFKDADAREAKERMA